MGKARPHPSKKTGYRKQSICKIPLFLKRSQKDTANPRQQLHVGRSKSSKMVLVAQNTEQLETRVGSRHPSLGGNYTTLRDMSELRATLSQKLIHYFSQGLLSTCYARGMDLEDDRKTRSKQLSKGYSHTPHHKG